MLPFSPLASRLSLVLILPRPRLAKALDLENLTTVQELDFHSKVKIGEYNKGLMTIEVSYHLYHSFHKIFPILNNVKHCQCLFSVQRQVLMSSATVYRTTIETEKFFVFLANNQHLLRKKNTSWFTKFTAFCLFDPLYNHLKCNCCMFALIILP